MTKISELIEKLRGLTEPDRQVDAEITRIFDLPRCVEPDCLPDVFERVLNHVAAGGDDPEVLAYTGSLNAVAALIERDGNWDWSLFHDNGEAIAGCQPSSDDGCDYAGVHAPTPALALLIAFLQAKMAAKE